MTKIKKLVHLDTKKEYEIDGSGQGSSSNTFENIVVSGNITDGTNSVKVSDIASKEELNDVVEIAEGKTKAYVVSFNDEEYLVNNIFNSNDNSIAISGGDFKFPTVNFKEQITYDKLNVGDIIYITNLNVPDRWVSDKDDYDKYIVFTKMETTKVNIPNMTNYVQKSELNNLLEAYLNEHYTNGNTEAY